MWRLMAPMKHFGALNTMHKTLALNGINHLPIYLLCSCLFTYQKALKQIPSSLRLYHVWGCDTAHIYPDWDLRYAGIDAIILAHCTVLHNTSHANTTHIQYTLHCAPQYHAYRVPTSIGNSVRFNWPHVTGESQQFIHTVGP